MTAARYPLAWPLSLTCPQCAAAIYPDAHEAELRAGKLRWRCSFGHALYQVVPPMRTEHEAEIDALASLEGRAQSPAAAARACEVCGEAMGDEARHWRRRHPACRAVRPDRPARNVIIAVKARSGRRAWVWTTPRLEELARLWNRGEPPAVIAAAMGLGHGRSINATVSEFRRRMPELGLASRSRGPQMEPR